MEAYRSRYAELQKMGATVLAISSDDQQTLVKFKAATKAPFPFIPDPEGKLIRLFDVKTPLVTYAKRTTFVVGEGLKVLAVQTGSDAIDASNAVRACSLHHGAAKPNPGS